MKNPLVMMATALLGVLSAPFAGPPLGVGDTMPAFTLAGSDGKSHTLGEHVGKRVVVLAWFPKAFTGG